MVAAAYDQLERLSALLPLVAGVRTAADLEAVLPAVAEAAYEASGAQCVAILLRSRSSGAIQPVAFHGPHPLRDRLVAAAPPAAADDAVWVPLTDTDETLLGYLGASGLPEGAGDLLAAVAAYGGQALRRARASIAAARHREALEALMRLRAEFDFAAGIDALLAQVVDAVRETLGFRHVSIELGAHDVDDLRQDAAVVPLREGEQRGVLIASDPPDGGPIDAEALAILRLFAGSAANRILAVEAHDAAERLAGADALTGLGHRGTFVRRAEQALRSAEREAAILLCDMDGLKEINDSLGHAAGDARLRLTAGVLAAACREGESAHRIGGDEFAVLVSEGGRARAQQLAGEIEAGLRAAGASASIGWAAGGAHATVDELLDRADTGMYRVKRGRSRGGDAGRPIGTIRRS